MTRLPLRPPTDEAEVDALKRIEAWVDFGTGQAPNDCRVDCRCGATVAAWALAERGGVCPCCGNRCES